MWLLRELVQTAAYILSSGRSDKNYILKRYKGDLWQMFFSWLSEADSERDIHNK